MFYFEDFTEIGKKLNIKIGEQKKQIILLPFKANLSELEFTDWNFDGVLDNKAKKKSSFGLQGTLNVRKRTKQIPNNCSEVSSFEGNPVQYIQKYLILL